MSAIPFEGDPTENETVIKFCMNVNNLTTGRLEPHMEKITLTCLKQLTDTRLAKEDEAFKVITAKFIKNVIMTSEEHRLRLVQLEAQMSSYERSQLAKYMQKA
jgi:hypothetical protein